MISQRSLRLERKRSQTVRVCSASVRPCLKVSLGGESHPSHPPLEERPRVQEWGRLSKVQKAKQCPSVDGYPAWLNHQLGLAPHHAEMPQTWVAVSLFPHHIPHAQGWGALDLTLLVPDSLAPRGSAHHWLQTQEGEADSEQKICSYFQSMRTPFWKPSPRFILMLDRKQQNSAKQLSFN